MKKRPVRKQNRIQNYDYSQDGAYFVTICTKDREALLGEIIVGDGLARPAHISLTNYGIIVANELQQIPSYYDIVDVNQYAIMPNHIHMIITIGCTTTERKKPLPTLGNIVGGFKSGVSRLCGFSLWQRSFHDHVIRDYADYCRIAEYIVNNPATWERDIHFVTDS